MVIALNCLMVARARLMLAGFLVWFALPALSSLPHSGVSQLRALSSVGPFNAWAEAVPAKHKAPTAAAMTVSLFIRNLLLVIDYFSVEIRRCRLSAFNTPQCRTT